MGQNSQALAAHERFLQRFPQDPDRNKVLIQMGEINEELKDYEAAMKNYKSVPDNVEESFGSLLAQARLSKIMKQPNQELALYEKLRSKGPRNNEIRLTGMVTLAELYQELGKVEDSIAVYDDIAANSTNPEWKQAAVDRAKTLKAEAK
jgi:tetratricopeptide (TPR) repeat protein